MSQEFTMKNINETRNYFLEETEQNELMSTKKLKTILKLYTILSTFFASAITGYISISAFASLIVIPTGITSSANRIKKNKSVIKKKKNKYHKIVLLAK